MYQLQLPIGLTPRRHGEVDYQVVYDGTIVNRSRHSCKRVGSLGKRPSNASQADEDVFLAANSAGSNESSVETLPSSDLGERNDTLRSPRVSPVPWLRQSVPELVVTSSFSDQSGSRGSGSTVGDSENNLLTVPRKALRRNSSGSLHSASDESDTEPSPPVQRRGRRQAIFDSKSLGLADGSEDLSPSNSCDESEGGNVPAQGRSGRKRSSVDLGINYPGDLLVHHQRHHKKVLIKRNTIADFANTRAYQASTASLISEQDSKKRQSTFSLLKLIDKKSHRVKEHVSSLSDVLQHLKPSEFKDSHLTCYKDLHWSELIVSKDKESQTIPEVERKRREAVWELFRSECVFLIDHLMVLKHCFMEPIKKVQVEGHLMFAEPQDLFGNLDELCYVSYTFCRDFISLLLKDARATDFGRTEILIKALQRFCQLTRDGEVYHDYCLNYSKAMTYLEQLRRNEHFQEFEKWCEQDERCHRLQMTDLLISPMQHCTKVPLLLNNIRRYTEDPDERQQLTESLEKLETSLKNLEAKMKWLKNFERVQEIQQQIVWQPIHELEPRAFIPEFLKATLARQPCERLLASPKRQLLHEGPLTLLEYSKTVDMYMLLFDDILLLTRVKKPPRKKTAGADSNPMSPKSQTEGAVFVVHRQPIALDRFSIHDVRPPDAAANGLKHAFVLVQISRFQQIIGVYTLQAPSEAAKAVWLSQLHESQDKYKKACKRKDSFYHTASFNSSLDDTSIFRPVEERYKPPRRTRSSKHRKGSDISNISAPPPLDSVHNKGDEPLLYGQRNHSDPFCEYDALLTERKDECDSAQYPTGSCSGGGIPASVTSSVTGGATVDHGTTAHAHQSFDSGIHGASPEIGRESPSAFVRQGSLKGRRPPERGDISPGRLLRKKRESTGGSMDARQATLDWMDSRDQDSDWEDDVSDPDDKRGNRESVAEHERTEATKGSASDSTPGGGERGGAGTGGGTLTTPETNLSIRASLSPTRMQKLNMLKVIHEKSQSIDRLDPVYI